MSNLEIINGTDKGNDAIYKLDRNIKALSIEVENIDVTTQVAEEIKIHNEDADAHKSIQDKITDLSGQLNGYRIYTSFEELGKIVTTPISELVGAMEDKSILITSVYSTPPTVYPFAGGNLEIVRIIQARIKLTFSYGELQWIGYCDSGIFKGWKQIATTDKIDILATPNAGYSLFFKKIIK